MYPPLEAVLREIVQLFRVNVKQQRDGIGAMTALVKETTSLRTRVSALEAKVKELETLTELSPPQEKPSRR
ncbi:hypothetical protein ACIQF5_20940 [Streptomyces goshikiensis]|uniref:hypothetical protein n=1 Tax=Streptomyces goshikiensis TaxID=1942 RepID=UPI0038226F8D